jgi:hypothetical protein
MNAKQASLLVHDHFDEISESLSRGDTWLEIASRFEVNSKRQSAEVFYGCYHQECAWRGSPWRMAAMRWVLDNVEEITRLRNRRFTWAAVVGLLPPVPPGESNLSYKTPLSDHLGAFIAEYNDMIDRGIVVVPDRYPRKAPVSDEELLTRWMARKQVRTFSTSEAARCNGRRFARVRRCEAALGGLVERGCIGRLPPTQSTAGCSVPVHWEVLGEIVA